MIAGLFAQSERILYFHVSTAVLLLTAHIITHFIYSSPDQQSFFSVFHTEYTFSFGWNIILLTTIFTKETFEKTTTRIREWTKDG